MIGVATTRKGSELLCDVLTPEWHPSLGSRGLERGRTASASLVRPQVNGRPLSRINPLPH
jgi:hypothetical protein